MSEIALAEINSFAPVAQQADVQPSEPIFVLTSGQLKNIITQAIQEATEPILQEVQDLKAQVTSQEEKLAALEATQDLHAENDLNQLRLIADLRRTKEPTENVKNRQDILHALLAANNGKMLSSMARKKMNVPKSSFWELLKTCDFIEKRSYHLDPRQDVLVLI